MTIDEDRRTRRRGRGLGFWSAVGVWTGSLLVLASIKQAVSGVLPHGAYRPLDTLLLLPSWAGLFLPFCAFASGLVLGGGVRVAWMVRRGALVVLASYALLAFAAPIGVYQLDKDRGEQVAETYPFGPRTPVGLSKLRSAIEAAPPERFSFRIDLPFSLPPNWLTYLLHSPAVLALYSLLSILLGRVVARLTTGLSPPGRGHVRWAAGLGLGIVFFLAEAGGGEWVRSDPARSGFLGAWLPLVVPVVLLGCLEAAHQWRMRGADSPRARREAR